MRGRYITNFDKGLVEHYTQDITVDYLRDENITSLNNFIRYGSYEHGRDHHLTKNKSIADILLLSDDQCTILLNFIQLCRVNKDLIYNAEEEYEDDLFNKFLVSIQNAPNNLPMYFTCNNLDEEIFYYQLIRSLLKWIFAYESFCNLNGYNKLYTIGITDVTTFNGKLKEIADIMSEYLIKVKLVYPFDLEKKENEKRNKEKKMTKEDIKELIKEELRHEKEHHHHIKPRKRPTHIKHHYEFEKSGFNLPTLIKMSRSKINKSLEGNMIYCDPDPNKLIPKMDEWDFLYLPPTYTDTNIHIKFVDLRNIVIVGKNSEMYYTMEFENSTALIQNMTFKHNKESEDVKNEAILLTGESFVKLEDCIIKDYNVAINVPNDDSYSKAIIQAIDTIFTNNNYGIYADSPVGVVAYRSTFFNNAMYGIYVTHSNNNKTTVTIHDCEFLNNGTLLSETEKYSAIRLINNKISSRVGITAAYVEECRFVSNTVDIIIGENHSEITNVDMKYYNNIGLENIINYAEPENTTVVDEETDSGIDMDNEEEIVVVMNPTSGESSGPSVTHM